jgi:hypothetical protein
MCYSCYIGLKQNRFFLPVLRPCFIGLPVVTVVRAKTESIVAAQGIVVKDVALKY